MTNPAHVQSPRLSVTVSRYRELVPSAAILTDSEVREEIRRLENLAETVIDHVQGGGRLTAEGIQRST